MLNYPKVAIIYLSYHCELYLERALDAFKQLEYPSDALTLVVVDNLHPNYGSSADFIQQSLNAAALPFPTVVLAQSKNLGFAGGNNIGIAWALANNFDYIYLHNDDGFMGTHCLANAVEAITADDRIGAVQSRIMLFPETTLTNTSGNNFHYLGFGFCKNYRQPIQSAASTVAPIGYASGAGVLLRADLIRQFGPLDAEFFAYHEDLEYSLRLKFLGYQIVAAGDSVFYHEYEFRRNPEKFFLMERNRLGLWLMYWRWTTLGLLLPAAAVSSVGLLVWAIINGSFSWWLKVVRYWLNPMKWIFWLEKRAEIQKLRKLKDSDLLKDAVATIDFEGLSNGWLVRAGNYILNYYWKLIWPIIKRFN